MAIEDLDYCVGSWQLNSTNYSAGTIPDDSPLDNDLSLGGDGGPVWATRDSIEGMDCVKGTDWWWLEGRSLAMPELSVIFVMHADLPGNVFPRPLRTFHGTAVSGDHNGEPYDNTIDVDSSSILDKYIWLVSTNARFADRVGHQAQTGFTHEEWVILTCVYTANPEVHRIRVNDGSWVESEYTSNDYSMLAAGDRVRLGHLFTNSDVLGSPNYLTIGECHIYHGDVSDDSGYATEMSALKTKYGIT